MANKHGQNSYKGETFGRIRGLLSFFIRSSPLYPSTVIPVGAVVQVVGCVHRHAFERVWRKWGARGPGFKSQRPRNVF